MIKVFQVFIMLGVCAVRDGALEANAALRN